MLFYIYSQRFFLLADFFIERRGDYNTVRAKVVRSNLQMTNGVLYVIDRVLYEDNEEAFQALAVSSSSSLHCHHFGALFTILYSVMASRNLFVSR